MKTPKAFSVKRLKKNLTRVMVAGIAVPYVEPFCAVNVSCPMYNQRKALPWLQPACSENSHRVPF